MSRNFEKFNNKDNNGGNNNESKEKNIFLQEKRSITIYF